MNKVELQERLIDYVEGNISLEQKVEIELLLRQSPRLQSELETIRLVFNELGNTSDDEVPTHYFTNFLPRLRARIESGKTRTPLFFPEWLRLFTASSVVSIVAIAIIILYQSFKPEDVQSPIYSMVNDMERTEMNSIVDETILFEPNSGILRSAEIIANDISNANAVESKLTEDLLVLDVSTYQSDQELLSDIGDQEAEQVLDHLNKPSAR